MKKEAQEELEKYVNTVESLPDEEKQWRKKGLEDCFFSLISAVPEKDLAQITNKEIMKDIDLFARIVKGTALILDLIVAISIVSNENNKDLIGVATLCRKILPSLL